jgi:type IV pilus assembly protein PilN
MLPGRPTVGGDPWTVGLGALAVLIVALAGWSQWSASSAIGTLETQIAQEVTDSTRFATTIALIDGLRARQDTIQRKVEVIQSVDTRRYVWPRIMDEVSRAVTPNTWLTRLGAAEEADSAGRGPAFTIEGATQATHLLTGFMKNLEASPFLRDVTLVTTEQVSEGGRTYNRFTLEARFETPDPAFVETVPMVVLRK